MLYEQITTEGKALLLDWLMEQSSDNWSYVATGSSLDKSDVDSRYKRLKVLHAMKSFSDIKLTDVEKTHPSASNRRFQK